MIVHAGLVSLRLSEAWRGVLIIGPSGSGKSDLALRLLDSGYHLVADDRTLLWTSQGRLFGRAPDTLSGLIEMRGIDVVGVAHRPFCRVDLVADCDPGVVHDRAPEPSVANYLGKDIPRIGLIATQASAPAKLSRALMALG